MSRITNYSYTDSGLLKQIDRNGDVMEIIRPEDEATPVEGEVSIAQSATKLQSSGYEVQLEAGDQGTIRKVIYPSGKTVSTTFNKQLQPIHMVSEDQEVSMTYDEDGRIIKRKDERKGTLETFEYEGDHLVRRRDGEGRYTLWDYEDGLQIRKSIMNYKKDEEGKYIVDENGHKIEEIKVVEERQYNEIGLLATLTSDMGISQNFEYDQYGNLTEATTQNRSESYENDVLGNVTRHVQGNLTKEYLYDSFNRPVEVFENGARTGYKYDQHKRLIEIEQSNGKTSTFEYDIEDRLIEKRDVNGNAWTYEYNQKGEMIRKTKPDGVSITYEYDDNGNARLIKSGENVIEQVFDINNRMVSNKNGLIEIERAYDLTGTLKEETTLFDGDFKDSVKYSYDRSGLCTGITAADHEIDYGYDNFGVMSHIESGDFLLQLGSYKDKRPTTFAHEKFKMTRSGHGPQYKSAEAKVGTTKIFDQKLDYDQQGNCISKSMSDGSSWAFEYNAFNELNKSMLMNHPEGSSYQKDFVYDELGNRIKENNFSLIYDEAKYQLLEDERFEYSYDVNGNLTAKTNKNDGTICSYEYNAFDQLIAFTRKTDGGDVMLEAYYDYDGLSRRVRKKVIDHQQPENNIFKWYLHDNQNLLAEYDEDFNTTKFYVGLRFMDYTLGFVTKEKAYYYIRGKFNTVEAILNQKGELAAKYTYGPFGELLYETSSVDNDMLYIGREYDRELEAYYLRARHYDPNTGRFFQLDPETGKIHDPRSVLLKYSYGNNNPLKFFDPDGHKSIWSHIGELFVDFHPFAGFKKGFFAGLVHLIFWPFIFTGALIGGIIGHYAYDDFRAGAKVGAKVGFFVGMMTLAVIGAIVFPAFAWPIIIGGLIFASAGAFDISDFGIHLPYE